MSSHDPFSDAALKVAAQLVRESMLRGLQEDEREAHSFTEVFLEKIRKLVVLDRRRMRTRVFYRRVAGIILAILIGSGFFLAFNPEARADFLNWVRTTYENSILYEFFQGAKKEEATLPGIEFTWLPGEYEIQEIYNDGHSMTFMLTSSNDSMFLKCWIVENMDHFEVFSEDYSQIDCLINNRNATFYKAKDADTDNVIVWTREDNSAMYYLSSRHDMEEMVKVAESIKEK